MFENKFYRILFGAVFLLATWNYFSGLTIDVTRDAGKYATISKEILQTGNFVNLTVHGDPYDQKPPMTFWMGAAGMAIGGVSNFWFKFPILLLVFAGIYWAFRLGESLYNKRVGIITAGLLFFSFIYPFYSMDIHTDTPLQAFVALALWQLFEFIKTRKNINAFWGFTAIGLAMLCKGPVGAAIPAFAVIGHILLKKEYKLLTDYRWYAGTLLAFLIASPALIGLMNQFGWKGIRFFFWENNVGRITGTLIESKNDPFFFLHSLAYLFLPWSLLFFAATFAWFRTLVKNRFKSFEFFTLTGIWIYFIIISSASAQLPNYVFSIVPLMAVVTAKWADKALEENNRLFKPFNSIQFAITVFLWTLILAVAFYLFPSPPWFFRIFILLAICLTIFIYLRAKQRITKLFFPSIIAMVSLIFILNNHTFPFIFSHQAPPKAAGYFGENAKKNDKLYNYKYDQYELFFYSNPQAEQISTEKQLKKATETRGSWIFTNPEGLADLKQMNINTDTIIEYKHLYLNRAGKFILPKTRNEALKPMYLVKY